MKNISLYRQLQRVQYVLKQGTLETQDAEITELYNQLEESLERLLPSFLYPLLVDVLTYYGREILPALNLFVEDNRCISEGLDQSIQRLQVQEKTSKDLEARFRQMLLRVKSGTLVSIEDVVAIFCGIVGSGNTPGSAGILPASGKADVPSAFDAGKMPALPGYTLRDLEKQYRTLKKSAFTSKHVLPFFEALVSRAFSEEVKDIFARMQELFWHQLHELLQIKAVLVNTLTRKALITRLDVTTTVEQAGFDDLQFDNNVDEKMYQSCWNALRAAWIFLEERFPDAIPLLGGTILPLRQAQGERRLSKGTGVGSLKNHSFRVICRFPNPSAEYNDASASLLVGLKIVGDVLDLEIDPCTVVTGEVDSAGRILPVDHIAEKITAAEHHPDIRHIYLPHYGFVVRAPRITITPVRTFAEAVESYYSEQFRKKLQQVSRRQIFKGAIALATIPLGLFTFKNIFTHPVSEHDLRLLELARELYQKKSDYQSAIVIFESILNRFQEENSATETLQLKAQGLGHLGRIYLQQNQTQKGLSSYHQAFEFWKAIHDKERQTDILLYIGISHSDATLVTGAERHSKLAFSYYHQADDLLDPSMETFTRLRGNIALWSGVLYHTLEEYEVARTYVGTSSAYFKDADAPWNYLLSRQYLGSILVRLGEYDEAFEIFQQTLASPLFQNPFNQAKSFAGLCDLFFTTGKHEKGLQYAVQAEKLCKKCNLHLQRFILKQILGRYNIPFSLITSL